MKLQFGNVASGAGLLAPKPLLYLGQGVTSGKLITSLCLVPSSVKYET